MSETKHTPGPWYWCDEEGETALPYLTSQTGIICKFGNFAEYYPQCGDVPNEADARLIAAAPELLEALEAVEIAATMGFASAEILRHDSAIRKGIRAAIAKAKGEQP